MNTTKFSVEHYWNDGFVGYISIANNSSKGLNGWRLEFDSSFEIQKIWNAEIVSRKPTKQGYRYVVQNVDWNSDISSGSNTSFGFTAKYSKEIKEPSTYVLNGKSLSTPASVELPKLSVNDITVKEGDTGNNAATFKVELSEPSQEKVVVKYATDNGTAIAGSDYKATSGTLTFAPGETSKTIDVPILGDKSVESNEKFTLNLSNPTKAAIANGKGIATIQDNDSSQTNNGSSQTKDNSSQMAQKGTFNYGEALQKSHLFYEAQRSGRLPKNNRIEWRGDSALNDGFDANKDGDVNDPGDVNLTGGYYDAGDHVKFGFPMASSMTLLGWGVVEYRDAYQKSGQLDEALDAIKWGTDYILKAHVTDEKGTKEFWGQVGEGDLDHSYAGPSEKMTMNRPAFKIDRQKPGSDLAGEAAAALAAASIAFRPTDSAYADTLLKNAKQLYDFADTYRGKYSDSIPDASKFYNSWSGYQDELVWGAAWLYKATGDKSYLSKAESNYQGVWKQGTHNWDNKQNGAAVLLAQETDNARYRNDVESWLNHWSDKSGNGIKYTDGGLAWSDQWGSLRYSANTAFLAGVYSDTVNDSGDRYSKFAESQIDYMLGKNPKNLSYLVGFGDNFAKNPHHRGAAGGDGSWSHFNSSKPNEHILYGALVGGPASANDFDYVDSRTDYIRNEVALDYNAAFTGAVARMYQKYGGDPLSSSQLDRLPEISINT
jgi:Glycosyl hydrolase family 9/Calx-beta domain/Cellulose binding domain